MINARPMPPQLPARVRPPVVQAHPDVAVRPWRPAPVQFDDAAPPLPPDAWAPEQARAEQPMYRAFFQNLGNYGALAFTALRAATASSFITSAFVSMKTMAMAAGAGVLVPPLTIIGAVALGLIYLKSLKQDIIEFGTKIKENVREAYQSLLQKVGKGIEVLGQAADRINQGINAGLRYVGDLNQAFWASGLGQDLRDIGSSVAQIFKSLTRGSLYVVRKALSLILAVFYMVAKISDLVIQAFSHLQDIVRRIGSMLPKS